MLLFQLFWSDVAGDRTRIFFWTLERCAKCPSNPIILSRVFVSTDARQTDTFLKTVFSDSGVSKRKDLMKIPKVIFHIKPIPSYMMRM